MAKSLNQYGVRVIKGTSAKGGSTALPAPDALSTNPDQVKTDLINKARSSAK